MDGEVGTGILKCVPVDINSEYHQGRVQQTKKCPYSGCQKGYIEKVFKVQTEN